MQDVSYEPLMLRPSENPQASLDIFRQPHHHPFGSCIHRKAINKDKHLSSGFFFYHGYFLLMSHEPSIQQKYRMMFL